MVLKATGIKSPTKYTLALSVEESSSLVIVEKSSSAQELARSLSELGKTLHASVPGVEQYSLQGMPEADAAPLGVDDDTIGIPVYDLTVEESPEFFANGVLVHNSPIPRGGAMFKTDRLHYESNPPVTWKRGPVRGWDKAGTKTKRSAYTVGVKIAEDMLGRIWILDVIRDQWNSAEREDNMVSAGKADLPKGRQVVEQEPASSGLESADRTIKRMAREGVRCIAVPASGNKELRADSFSQEVNAGNVILVNAHWNKAFVEELKFFPRSKYKDQVDAASLAHSQLTGKKLKIGALR
jgi:predicted phage terminase large subunit-like protein